MKIGSPIKTPGAKSRRRSPKVPLSEVGFDFNTSSISVRTLFSRNVALNTSEDTNPQEKRSRSNILNLITDSKVRAT